VRPELYKVEGAGNDFVLGIGNWAERLAREEILVRRLCDRRRGIGGDGTLALTADSIHRVHLVYRNADGGEATFCANGTRCAARAAVELMGCAPNMTVVTGWSEIPAEVDGTVVSLELPAPSTGPDRLAINPPQGITELQRLVLGVPHVVGCADELGTLDLMAVAPALRSHPELGPLGANVNFFEVAADGSLAVRSYERGVEAETMCCGSGLVAVALLVMAETDTRRVELVARSGDRLGVEALGVPPLCATRFTGPARIVAAIEPTEGFLRSL
jgi:diaminopimelate epimerase